MGWAEKSAHSGCAEIVRRAASRVLHSDQWGWLTADHLPLQGPHPGGQGCVNAAPLHAPWRNGARLGDVHLLVRWLCGFVVCNGCLSVWWAVALSHCLLHTFSPPLPVFACLQAVGVNSLSPLSFFPKHLLSAVLTFLCSSTLFWLIMSLTGLWREGEREESNNLFNYDGPHRRRDVWPLRRLHQLSQVFHLPVSDTFVPQLKTHCSQQKAERKPFSFEEQEAVRSFFLIKGWFAWRRGALSALIDPSVCLKCAKSAQ